MAKFSSGAAVKSARPVRRAPIQTIGASGTTFEGGTGFAYDAKSELFLLAVTNMVGEDTFYESASDRDARFVRLVHQVTQEDPEWVAAFIPYLRKDMFMRSATVVAAAEYVAAGGPHGRAVVASALARPDEPGEIIAYWHQKYGRSLPKALKRGVAQAITHKIVPKDVFEEPVAGGTELVGLTDETSVQWGLFNENAAVKYDGQSKGIRLGDVIELVRPKAGTPNQNVLFQYLLDRRHHPDEIRADMSKLTRITGVQAIDKMTDDEFTAALKANPNLLADTGYTWERLASARPNLNVWDAIIPAMGYMALLRNLRNFEQKGISAASKKFVIDKLTDPEQVAKSMQFPYRFLSAHKYTSTHGFSGAIESALDLSVGNIPEVGGRTLVMIDVSASMYSPLSAKTTIQKWEVGALFGVAQALRAANADIVIFGTDSADVRLPKGSSVLRGIEAVNETVATKNVGHGTNTWQALDRHYTAHDRVFIFSDMQSTHYHGGRGTEQKVKTLYNFNLAGYGQTNTDLSQPGRYEFGGFSDATFRLIGMLERGKNAPWPWEA